jgi:6-pyruvoyltetrahydropterin/6-carboxytetrahydropterin synthase
MSHDEELEVLLARRAFFSCGLQLARDDWDAARNEEMWGKRSRMHGANYTLDVFYRGRAAREDGMIVNLDELKPLLANLCGPLDGAFLNDSEYLRGEVPTLEHLSRALWQRLPLLLGAGSLARLRLREGTRRWCEINRKGGEDSQNSTMKVTTTYEFAAAHRLHAPLKSEDENSALYGKCNNPRGHGHNYGLEVSVEGEPNPESGEIIPLQVLDGVVDREVFARFDHKHLNEDCPEFADLIPTSENLARVIFQVLAPALSEHGVRLSRVGLHETAKNYFEVEAPTTAPAA